MAGRTLWRSPSVQLRSAVGRFGPTTNLEGACASYRRGSMDRNASALLAPLHHEVAAVLAVLTDAGVDSRVRLNDLTAASGLPTGHVGRHLRTLERDRLVRCVAGAWQATLRGMRYAAVRGDQTPSSTLPGVQSS